MDKDTPITLTYGQVQDIADGLNKNECYIVYYSSYEKRYRADWGDNCTVKSINEEKLEQFIEKNGLSRNGIHFDYREEYDPETGEPTGKCAWTLFGMGGEIAIAPEDMESVTGVDVEIDDPEMPWAMCSIRLEINVDTNSKEEAGQYYGELTAINGSTGNDIEIFDLTGERVVIPCKAIVGVTVEKAAGDRVPNGSLCLLPYLRQCSISPSEVGNSVLSWCGAETDGMSVVVNAQEVGSNFLEGCKVSYIRGPVQSVGDSFMAWAEFVGNTMNSLGLLRTAGGSFMEGARFNPGGGGSVMYMSFGALEKAGDGFMARVSFDGGVTGCASEVFPKLHEVGATAFQETDLTDWRRLLVPAHLEKVGIYFGHYAKIDVNSVYRFFEGGLKRLGGGLFAYATIDCSLGSIIWIDGLENITIEYGGPSGMFNNITAENAVEGVTFAFTGVVTENQIPLITRGFDGAGDTQGTVEIEKLADLALLRRLEGERTSSDNVFPITVLSVESSADIFNGVDAVFPVWRIHRADFRVESGTNVQWWVSGADGGDECLTEDFYVSVFQQGGYVIIQRSLVYIPGKVQQARIVRIDGQNESNGWETIYEQTGM